MSEQSKEDLLWQKFMADNSFQDAAFPTTLTSNDNNTRKSELFVLTDLLKERANFDHFASKQHNLVVFGSTQFFFLFVIKDITAGNSCGCCDSERILFRRIWGRMI